MTDKVSAITDKDFIKRVRGQINVAESFGGDAKFSMDLTTAKRLLALAQAAVPSTDVAVAPMIDITPSVPAETPQ